MGRTADYTIKGFLYQFNKTLFEILESNEGTVITVEGIVEDIDLSNAGSLTAIQCKYHEAAEHFVPSIIYRPLLQMMSTFHQNPNNAVTYILYCYFPGKTGDVARFGKAEMEEALNSTNKDLRQYTDSLKGQINIDAFLERFSLRFGKSYDDLADAVCSSLEKNGIPKEDIPILGYPNAVHSIANLSIRHNPEERKITREQLVTNLLEARNTAISRWTLALKSRKQILEARRKQLKANLDKNSRLRYFLVNAKSLDDFDSEIVKFVGDYLEKYHFKAAHINTPIFCLATTEQAFRDIQLRIHRKGISSTDGYVGTHFDPQLFFRNPMSRRTANRRIEREFSLRLLHWETNGPVIGDQKADDLFLLGACDYADLDTVDVNVEVLAAETFKEIKFLMGVSNAYD